MFRMPGTPLAPIKGEHAPLGRPARVGTTLAIFQVVAADTHDNYIACRGYEAETDQTFTYLHDHHQYPGTTPINVAKPYPLRGTFHYAVGEIVVAARIRTRFGQNPGKASVTVGQPADLDEATELLLDDAGVAIAWLDIGNAGPRVVFGKAVAEMSALTGTGSVDVWMPDFSSATGETLTGCINTYGLPIEADARCRVEIIGGYRVASPMECPTTP